MIKPEKQTLLYFGNLFPVDNGSKSTAVSLIKELSLVRKLNVIIVSNESTDKDQVTAFCKSLSVEILFLELKGTEKIFLAKSKFLLFILSMYKLNTLINNFLERAGFYNNPAPILFVDGWSPLAFSIKKFREETILLIRDSITLFEKNRIVINKRSLIKKKLSVLIATMVEFGTCKIENVKLVYVSNRDKNQANLLSKRLKNKKQLYVMPLGVDKNDKGVKLKPSKEFILIFSGALSYLPNLDAVKYLAEEIIPMVGNLKCTFRIVGKDGDKIFGHLANELIEVIGWTDQYSDYHRTASAFVCPLRMGSGSKNKVLQALSFGLPVLGSEEAFSGFDTLPPGAILCKTPSDYRREIKFLIENPSELKKLKISSSSFMEKNFSWKKSVSILLDVSS